MSPAFDKWFLPIRSTGNSKSGNSKPAGSKSDRSTMELSAVKVLCLPYSGLGTSMFAAWRPHLPEDAHCFAVQLPGREQRLREQPYTQLMTLAQDIADVLSKEDPGATYCLAGFSLGGLLAYEIGRLLQASGVRVPLVVAGAVRAPQGKWKRGKLHTLAEQKFLRELDRSYGAVPWQVIENEEMRNLVVPMLRGDIAMYETYQFASGDAFDGELLTLAGSDDAVVRPKHVSPWRELAKSYRHRTFVGDHFFARTQTAAVVRTIFNRVARISA